MLTTVKEMGPFRWFLVGCSIILMGFAFLAMEWYDTINTSQKITIYVAGSMVPIFFFLLLFDMMMNRIQMAEKTPEQKQRFRKFTWIELAVLVLLILSWYPFYDLVLS